MAKNPLGGIRSYILYNGRFLSSKGYHFSFVAPAGPGFDEMKSDTSFWPGIKYFEIPRGAGFAGFLRACRAIIQKEKPCLIHSQGLQTGTIVSLAALNLGVPHIITLHDVIVAQNEIPGRFKHIKKAIIGFVTAMADVIVAVSNDCAENHLEHFSQGRGRKCCIQVIQNGVDIHELRSTAFNTPLPSIRKSLNISDDVALAGFFGRFMPQKGFLVLLDAIRLLHSDGNGEKIRFVVTQDPHGYRREYIGLVQRDLVLSRMIHFVDPVPNIAPLLSQMDLLVMPSLWEACGLLAMEAMVLGIPVVGSNAIGLREVLCDTPSLRPRANDSVDLAAAIETMLANPVKAAAQSYAEAAAKRFDSLIGKRRLLALYQSYISEKADL